MENSEFIPDIKLKTLSVEDEEAKNNPEQLEVLLKDYFFDFEEKFNNKDFKKLAKLEKNSAFNQKGLARNDEITRCKLKKKLEAFLLEKNEKDLENFWQRRENEYRDHYGRNKEKESKISFETLKHGTLNEIIAKKILEELPDFQFNITKSEVDIDYKIDIIGFSNDNKVILSIQVKQGSRYEKEKTKPVQEIDKPQQDDTTKNEFLNGCSRLKNELKLDDENVVFKNIWITIPAREKIGEGGKYSHNLQNIIIKNIEKILEREN